MTKLNTLMVVTAACTAFRVNNNKLINKKTQEEDTITNRTLVDSILSGHDAAPISTSEDRELAQTIIDDLQQRHTINALTNKSFPEFTEKVVKAVTDETTALYNVGFIVWAPKLYMDLQRSDDAQNTMALLSYRSKFIGKCKDKIEITFVTIVERYTTHYGCWRYTGHDTNGNLVGFLTKDKLSDETVRIKARVKTHERSRFTKGNTTYLNYVKEIK